MASNATVKSFSIITKPVRRRPSTACLYRPLIPQGRCLSATSHQYRDTTYPSDGPRWHQSPPAMRAPFRHRVNHQTFIVNSDPVELDAFYVRFLGPGGDRVLTEEVKWLAVTHKSFDHGSRGFCDRLAFLGRRIVQLQKDLVLLHSREQPPTPDIVEHAPDQHPDRIPFDHPALAGLQNLTRHASHLASDKLQMGRLGESYGLLKVVRWKPKNPSDLEKSGVPLVLTQSIYAIIGAVALQKGGEVAARVAKERVLGPLGLSV